MKYIIDEWRRDRQWILHPKGKEIYRPRPEAEVCKFLDLRGVKSIDDWADIRQCYSHMRHYMKKSWANDLHRSQKVFLTIIKCKTHEFLVKLHSYISLCICLLFCKWARAGFDLPTNQEPTKWRQRRLWLVGRKLTVDRRRLIDLLSRLDLPTNQRRR